MGAKIDAKLPCAQTATGSWKEEIVVRHKPGANGGSYDGQWTATSVDNYAASSAASVAVCMLDYFVQRGQTP